MAKLPNKIILGTVQFGLNYGISNLIGKPSREQVFEMLDYAASQGVKLLDTADAYGTATNLLGDFNNVYPSVFSINTKFKSKKESLSKQLSNSLNLLNIEIINTYFFHSYTDFTDYPELLQELVALKQENMIRKIGVSVYDNSEFITAINTPEVDVIQFPFNLFDNWQQRGELISLAKSKGKQLQVRSVFLQGLFFKTPESLPVKLLPLKPYLINLKNLAHQHNIEIERLALSYALQQKEIDFVIIGVDNLNQLQRNIEIAEMVIDPEIIQAINQIKVTETELLYPKNWN